MRMFKALLILLLSTAIYADSNDEIDITDRCPVPPQEKPEGNK